MYEPEKVTPSSKMRCVTRMATGSTGGTMAVNKEVTVKAWGVVYVVGENRRVAGDTEGPRRDSKGYTTMVFAGLAPRDTK